MKFSHCLLARREKEREKKKEIIHFSDSFRFPPGATCIHSLTTPPHSRRSSDDLAALTVVLLNDFPVADAGD